MTLDLDKLSLKEIRAHLLDSGQPVSRQLLAKLRKDPRQGVRQLHDVLERRFERERDERLRLDAMLNFERVLWRSGVRRIAGVDEAGVGPLAGPVVAAAVVFPPDTALPGIDDSKRLDATQREAAAEAIRARASGIGVGIAEVAEVDTLNVYQAALTAMRRAVDALPEPPEHILVDARTIPGLEQPQNPFNKGDGINFSIAAASILAKCHRDALMVAMDAEYPGYGFARHKGYGTTAHQQAIRELGPCPLHRRSFPFIRELRGEYCTAFYTLRERLDQATTVAALREVERAVGGAADGLEEFEARKLKTLISRRWKTL